MASYIYIICKKMSWLHGNPFILFNLKARQTISAQIVKDEEMKQMLISCTLKAAKCATQLRCYKQANGYYDEVLVLLTRYCYICLLRSTEKFVNCYICSNRWFVRSPFHIVYLVTLFYTFVSKVICTINQNRYRSITREMLEHNKWQDRSHSPKIRLE